MASKNDELEPFHPQETYKLFLEHKTTESSESTVQNYKYRLKPLGAWCEEQNLTDLNDLSGRDINKFRLWWKRTAGLALILAPGPDIMYVLGRGLLTTPSVLSKRLLTAIEYPTKSC
jgi:hypothetical protein